MAAARVVVDTIPKIMERMSSLPDFGDKTITENIKRYLSTIREVAEHGDDAATPSMNWLFGVTDALNDLWDLLEDRDLPKQSNNIASFFSPCSRTPHRRRSLLLVLEQIEKQLQLVAADSSKALPENTEKLKTNSDQETEMVGRENLKEQLISQVLALGELKGCVNVVPILGMRGMGKTTLVRSVCRDERVRRSFDGFVIWVDGIHSEVYAKSIFKCIIRRMKKKDDKDLKLGKALSRRRFLLVLDELQNETPDEWITLKQMLANEASSSITFTSGTILVTTQNYFVAEGAPGCGYFAVDELGEVDSWALFERIAGEGGAGSRGLKIKDAQMKKMVKKCGGVPIAIVKLARMLKAITEPDIEPLEEELMREMKLIYYDELPSWHQKQCFAYLSMIFPSASDSVHKNTLIRLWMAEGLLGQLQPEVLGDECLEEFIRRSILRCHTCRRPKVVSRYSMYSGLVLELSRFVAGKDCFCTDYYGDDNVKETVRRVVLTPDFDVSNGIPKFLSTNNKNLRSIIFLMPYNNGWPSRIPHEVKLKWPLCDSIFRTFNNLRVLNLTDLGMKMLPVSVGELKSLRYLDLSHNNMKKLPNSIGKLRHLQTLILSHCHKLRGLPNEVRHLVSLRHLEMEGCLHLTHLPSALKKLTNLQTLSPFMVSTSNSNSNSNSQKHTSGLGQLVNMNNLGGELEISHLERLKFKEPEHPGYAYLKEKEHLECLNLQWNHEEDDNDHDHDNNHEQISLGRLEPHPNLEVLEILGYKGIHFSQWFSSLKNLFRLVLYNCSKCKYLPPLYQFPELQLLRLERLDSLECITDQDDNCNELGLGRLKSLHIRDCPNLTSWWKGRTRNNARFGSMSRIEVRYCPKLECMPLFPDLYLRLVLESSSVKPLLDTINYTSASNGMMPSGSDSIADSFPPLCKLDDLKITNVEEQPPLPENWLKNFISLRRLCISEKMSLIKGFKHLISLKLLTISNCARVDLPGDEWEGLQSLQKLWIEEVTELECLPEGFKHLTSLTSLVIERCPELTTLSEGISHLTSLKYLEIAECKKLASLPKGMTNLTSLNKLIIVNCPLLLPRCQEGTGDDWPQIQHIKDGIQLSGISEVYDE